MYSTLHTFTGQAARILPAFFLPSAQTSPRGREKVRREGAGKAAATLATAFCWLVMALPIASIGMLVPVPPAPPTDFPRNDLVAAQSGLPQQTRLPQHGGSAIFPSEWSPPATTLVSEAEAGADQLDDGSTEAKERGRLILAAIVCNSVFWQYVLPTLKGEENALGKLLNRDGEGK